MSAVTAMIGKLFAFHRVLNCHVGQSRNSSSTQSSRIRSSLYMTTNRTCDNQSLQPALAAAAAFGVVVFFSFPL